MNPASTSAGCDSDLTSDQDWQEGLAITPTIHGRHLAANQRFEGREERGRQRGNDTDPTLSGRVDGKSIKVYELDADTGIEECAGLEKSCLLMLGNIPWEDIQLQFGSPRTSSNLSREERIYYEEILEMFNLANYQLEDVTVSEEGLQFVVDHFYEKKRSRQGLKGEHFSEDYFEEEGVEYTTTNPATLARSTRERTYSRSGRVLERRKTYEKLTQHAPSSDYLPMGPPRPGLRSTSRDIISDKGVVRKVKIVGRLSLRSEFTKDCSGCNECDEYPETETDVETMKDQNSVDYFLGNPRSKDFTDQSSGTVDQSISTNDEGLGTWSRASASPTGALLVCSDETRRIKNRQYETRRLTCPHLQIVTDPLLLDTPSSPLGHLKTISLENLGTVNRRSKVQRGFAIPDDPASTESDGRDILGEGPKRLSRMQSIFASRQLNKRKSFEEAPFYKESTNTQLSKTEFDTQVQETIYSRNEEEYTLAASLYEMTGRKYRSRSRSSSNQSTKSNRSMVMDVDPELLAWMKKEVLTVKVRRDSEVTVPDANSYVDSRRNSHVYFGDQTSTTPAPIGQSPQHSFSDAAFAIALRAPNRSRLPCEGGENTRSSGGYFTSSLSRSSYMPICFEQNGETCPRKDDAEGAVVPTVTTAERLEDLDARLEGATNDMGGTAESLNGIEAVFCALTDATLGSDIKVPCQMCITDLPH
ncbi:hypothetical protein DFP73DRAFT_592753 [Morchella snyderi]|nr:hypothetical protein DFP73DRAFT_592753 [Morchella snyderi]